MTKAWDVYGEVRKLGTPPLKRVYDKDMQQISSCYSLNPTSYQ